jgi:hypothetical protein
MLNLQPTATTDEIKAAYARERERWIAQGTDLDQSDSALQALDAAYTTLIDPNQRIAYDRALSSGPHAGALVLAGSAAVPAPLAAPPVPGPQQACPHCGALNPTRATICLMCHRQISLACPQCGQPVQWGQAVCPRCETVLAEYNVQRQAQKEAVEQTIQRERREASARIEAGDALYRVQVRMGAIFWIIVVLVCIGMALFTVFISNVANR